MDFDDCLSDAGRTSVREFMLITAATMLPMLMISSVVGLFY